MRLLLMLTSAAKKSLSECLHQGLQLPNPARFRLGVIFEPSLTGKGHIQDAEFLKRFECRLIDPTGIAVRVELAGRSRDWSGMSRSLAKGMPVWTDGDRSYHATPRQPTNGGSPRN